MCGLLEAWCCSSDEDAVLGVMAFFQPGWAAAKSWCLVCTQFYIVGVRIQRVGGSLASVRPAGWLAGWLGRVQAVLALRAEEGSEPGEKTVSVVCEPRWFVSRGRCMDVTTWSCLYVCTVSMW